MRAAKELRAHCRENRRFQLRTMRHSATDAALVPDLTVPQVPLSAAFSVYVSVRRARVRYTAKASRCGTPGTVDASLAAFAAGLNAIVISLCGTSGIAFSIILRYRLITA